MTKLRFYVDGFNFYHGIVKAYDIKWVDLGELFLRLLEEPLKNHGITHPEIEKLYYFTAQENDISKQNRQKIYFNALRAKYGVGTKKFITKWGTFRSRAKKVKQQHIQTIKCKDKRGRIQLIDNKHEQQGILKVYYKNGGNSYLYKVQEIEYKRPEEKETDVNLVCQMLKDIYTEYNQETKNYIPVLVSNDSDFTTALEIVRKITQRNVFLIVPVSEANRIKRSSSLKRVIQKHQPENVIDHIKKEDVEACLLPGKVGNHTRPEGW